MFKWLFASAFAESAVPAAGTVTQTAAPVAETVIQTAAPAVKAAAFSDTLMGKGLITTGLGLAGVFLVLCLFYLVIKLMQRVKDKE